MKKLFVILILSMSLSLVYSQNILKESAPYMFYCELFGKENFADQLRLKIYWNNSKYANNLRDQDGNKVEFCNLSDMFNYMSKRGWEYVESINVEGVYHFIFRKEVSSDEEAKKGLYFETDFDDKKKKSALF